MTLCWTHIADSAVSVLVVVPVDKPTGPVSRVLHVRKPCGRVLRPILRRAEQRLDEGVVVADPWTRVRGLQTQPGHHRQHGSGLHRRAIVTVENRLPGQTVDPFGQRGSP